MHYRKRKTDGKRSSFSRNQASFPGLKRHKTCEKFEASKQAKKGRFVEDEIARSPSPSSSGDLVDEKSSGAPSTVSVYKESSIYDSLLMTLQSSNVSLADAYKKRQREEGGKSSSEDDEDDLESLSASENGGTEEGTDNDSLRSDDIESNMKEPDNKNIVDENSESENDTEASDIEQECNKAVDTQAALDTGISRSPFHIHLDYKLSEEEANNLSNKKQKYSWEMPAFDMPNCKWTGSGDCFLEKSHMDPGYGLKQSLYNYWLDIYKMAGGKNFHSSKQRYFFSLCSSYRDILHSNKKPFYHKGLEEDSSFMDAYLMHSLNHIFRTRDLVKKNDSKVVKHKESSKDEFIADDNFLDHGFTRPKVLILLPMRHIAHRIVKRLIELTPQAYKVNVDHIDRFVDEFGVQDDEENMGNKSSKPADYQALFVGKNTDDNFMLGIKFTRKSIKLYSDFYSSDIIIASPLKLHDKIAKAEINKEFDVDYLSSIEVLIIDHADIIAMQNWAFLTSVVEKLNRIPSKQHGTDIMRIRKWYLEGHAKFYRQTILLGYYVNPDINALFNHQCVNYQGKVKLTCEYKGMLPKVLLQVRQIYERLDASSVIDADDARLEYFTKKVFPKIKDASQGGTMLFISSYFEYVRVRNFLKSQNASFCLLSEYTKPSDISRSRVWFFEGKRKIMLYTERAHFYHRYKIRGIRNLIIYSLPERKEFYPEVLNMLDGAHDTDCTVLFSRFDQLRLERIVGSTSARRMITSEKNMFVFC
ncbi:hypothetical protein K2173_018003 [Erythroxylum novogranatense]|uniref:U3 small nucleolar RNA-associated protein 25 n=1 Tax=Erythroxylum novogranatense TaxID=1862640 RepID=A0AAV8TU27_9ROSI|nr:hypothetical protein K2173_018003 [Erythroxylum novogranatense]